MWIFAFMQMTIFALLGLLSSGAKNVRSLKYVVLTFIIANLGIVAFILIIDKKQTNKS